MRTITILCGFLAFAAGKAHASTYLLLLESRADTGAGSEVFIASYATYDALINSPPAVGGDFSGIDIGPGYSVGGLAYDGMFRLLLTTNADSGAGSEVFIASYATYDALINSPPAVGGDFSGIDIGPGYSVGGLAYDGMFRLLLTTNADSGAGSEVFIASYATYDALINSPPAVGGDFSGIDIGPGYSVGGLAYDGMFRLLLTTNADSGAGSEVFIASYATYDALINSPPAVGGDFSGIDIGPGYSVGGLAYDGMFRLLLTTNADSGAGSEVFIASYATYNALINSPPAVGGDFSGINIGPGYSVRGLTYAPIQPDVDPPAVVPLPATLPLLGVFAGGLLGWGRKRKRSV